jgi:hypothetical protein
MNTRINPFADLKNVPVFETRQKSEKPVARETLDRIADENNFPSRQAKKTVATVRRRRVYRTGRNQHLGVKASAETVERFYRAADERSVPLGRLLELALDALEKMGQDANAGVEQGARAGPHGGMVSKEI